MTYKYKLIKRGTIQDMMDYLSQTHDTPPPRALTISTELFISAWHLPWPSFPPVAARLVTIYLNYSKHTPSSVCVFATENHAALQEKQTFQTDPYRTTWRKNLNRKLNILNIHILRNTLPIISISTITISLSLQILMKWLQYIRAD